MIAKFDCLANSLELGTRKVLDMSWTVELKGKKLPEPFGLLQFFMSYIEIGQYRKGDSQRFDYHQGDDSIHPRMWKIHFAIRS